MPKACLKCWTVSSRHSVDPLLANAGSIHVRSFCGWCDRGCKEMRCGGPHLLCQLHFSVARCLHPQCGGRKHKAQQASNIKVALFTTASWWGTECLLQIWDARRIRKNSFFLRKPNIAAEKLAANFDYASESRKRRASSCLTCSRLHVCRRSMIFAVMLRAAAAGGY